MEDNNKKYNIEKVLKHFIYAGLWASYDDDDEFLDASYDIEDVDINSQRALKIRIKNFILKNTSILERHNITEEMLGHDLFFSSRGHGVGFWDRGYGSDGEDLHNSSEDHFDSDPPDVEASGKIYFMEGLKQ